MSWMQFTCHHHRPQTISAAAYFIICAREKQMCPFQKNNVKNLHTALKNVL